MSTKSSMLASALALAWVSTSVSAAVIGTPGMPNIESLGAQQLVLAKAQKNGLTPADKKGPFVSNGTGPVNSKIYGKTYAEWTAEWWKWALSFPIDSNPITDTTGEYCDQGQSGPVWFLAGTNNFTSERTCTIPAGKAIFYPVVNALWSECPNSDDQNLSDNDVRWILANWTATGDPASHLTTTLNAFTSSYYEANLDMPISGLMIPAVRIQSPVFNTFLPDNSLLKDACPVPPYPTPMPPGKTGRLLSEGHWVMLPPLKDGEHLLKLHGSGLCTQYLAENGVCNFGDLLFETAVTYHLTVPGGKK